MPRLQDPAIATWLKDKGHSIIDVPFQNTMALGCNFMSLGADRVSAPASQSSPHRSAARQLVRGLGHRHERNI
jgi:N-dimethylarginine dimethylaminohydrolase